MRQPTPEHRRDRETRTTWLHPDAERRLRHDLAELPELLALVAANPNGVRRGGSGRRSTPGSSPPASAGVGALLGAWFGWRRHRLTFWRLDAQSLGVRRGHMWQSESHVPVSRVQHLDLRRGPLERMAGLATLIVHTAGTRMNTVAVAGLAHADAERLRDRLARQLDHDDDAL